MLALSVAATGATDAARPSPMLPPEISSQFWPSILDGLAEPPLWRPQAAKGYRSRIRLSLAGILRAKASISIEEHAGGSLSGRFTLLALDERARPADSETRRFRVSPAQARALSQLIDQAGLWAIYPQFYVNEDICVDGMEMVLERVDARGYRFSNANAQCTAPPELLRVAEKMIEIARAKQIRSWLD